MKHRSQKVLPNHTSDIGYGFNHSSSWEIIKNRTKAGTETVAGLGTLIGFLEGVVVALATREHKRQSSDES